MDSWKNGSVEIDESFQHKDQKTSENSLSWQHISHHCKRNRTEYIPLAVVADMCQEDHMLLISSSLP